MGLKTQLIKRLLNKSLVTFVYHDVTDTPSKFSNKYNLCITPNNFEKQVNVIRKLFNIISPKQLLYNDFKQPAALITFDDGFKSYFDFALPILSNLGIPSINFINYGVIKNELFWPGVTTFLTHYDDDYSKYKEKHQVENQKQPEFLYVNEDFVSQYLKGSKSKELLNKLIRDYQGDFANKNDLIKSSKYNETYLGSHLYEHFNCANIANEKIEQQQLKNAHYLSKYTNYLKYFAYPFGQPGTCFNDKTTNTLAELGIQKIFTSSGTVAYDSLALVLDRISLPIHITKKSKVIHYLYKRLIRQHLGI